MTASDDSAAYTRRKLAEGWRRLPSVLLDPDSAQALDRLRDLTGRTQAVIIRDALIASAAWAFSQKLDSEGPRS